MIMFALSTDSNWTSDAPEIHPPAACRPVLLDTRGPAGRIGEGPPPDLQHKGVTEHRRGGAGGIRVGRDIVGRQHKAVVHIPGTDDVLIDLVRFEIPSGRSRYYPVRRHLDRRAAQKSLAAGQVSQFRLRRIVAVHHADRPAVEGRPAFSLETLNVYGFLVQASAYAEGIGSVGRIVDAADVVRLWCREAGIDAGIG